MDECLLAYGTEVKAANFTAYCMLLAFQDGSVSFEN